jgi:hypothetical protein
LKDGNQRRMRKRGVRGNQEICELNYYTNLSR